MPEQKNVLFDLDGTLSDPREGITKCIQHALKELNYATPIASDLEWCIGPPLRESFTELLGTDDKEKIELAVLKYRERFASVGLFENFLYPEIPEILEELNKLEFRLYVITVKPRVYAKRIVEHFSLMQHFVAVYGVELDGSPGDKTALVELLLKSEQLSGEETIIVGDRASDIEAGKRFGLSTIAVSYGFGHPNELVEAKPEYLVSQPGGIRNAILQKNRAN